MIRDANRICWWWMMMNASGGLLQKFLMRNGFLVTVARDAAQARRLLAGLEFDMIVHGRDDAGRGWRDADAGTAEAVPGGADPAFDRAKGEAANRIEGFEAGADDYLVKPFEPKELLLADQCDPAAGYQQVKAEEPGPKLLHIWARCGMTLTGARCGGATDARCA